MEFTGKTHTHTHTCTLIIVSFPVKKLVRPKTPWKFNLPQKGSVQQLCFDHHRKRNSMVTSVLSLLAESSLRAADSAHHVQAVVGL